MKKIQSAILSCFFFFGVFSTAEAYYYMPTNYVSYPSIAQNSYTYTQGCYTYQYNGQMRATSIISYNCQQNYTYYTQPTYSYTYPTSYSYYNSGYTNTPYYVYGQDYSFRYPQYSNYYSNGYTNTNYYNGYYSGGNSGCYWQSGYQVCY